MFQVYVCSSLANLYSRPNNENSEWELCFTGIPVVLLDIGEAKSRDKRKIQIILAERGTGFMLWRDTIDNLTSYKVSGNAFHTMCLSSDHSTLIGISFDIAQSAQDMWNHIEQLVSCPENISLSAPGKKKKKKEKKPSKPQPLPPKSHISQPCCFQVRKNAIKLFTIINPNKWNYRDERSKLICFRSFMTSFFFVSKNFRSFS